MNSYSLERLKSVLPKIAAGVVVVLVLSGLSVLGVNFFNSLQPPHVVAINPKNNDIQADPFTSITILFDRDISVQNKQRFSIFPDTPGQFFFRGRLFEFVPNTHLKFGQQYTIALNRPLSSSGKEGDSIAAAFTVKKIDSLSENEKHLLQKEQDAAVRQQAGQIAQTLDGRKAQAKINLISSVPYEAPDFTVEYLRDQDSFYVTIKKNPYNTSKQEALDWFKSKGVEDMSWINVQYGSVRGVYP